MKNMPNRPRVTLLPVLLFLFTSIPQQPAHGETFELRDADRVVFLGNSFFERALNYGMIESRLSLAWPGKNIRFRNLGWDGDTVYGHARAGGRRRAVFGDPAEGFERMVDHLKSWSPTVVFLAYGYNESFDEEAGLGPFRAQLQRLISALESPTTRFVLISPTFLETGFGSSLQNPQVDAHVEHRNKWISKYAEVLADVAAKGHHRYVDLTKITQQQRQFTENGIHLSSAGYQVAAGEIASQLEIPKAAVNEPSRDAKQLRRLIVRKNTLYFHRWRPRNDAFVFGERKDEQKTAQQEPQQFEAFINTEEHQIQNTLEGLEATK